jgi:hypothetical protein
LKTLQVYIQDNINGWNIKVWNDELITIEDRLYIYDDLWEIISELQGKYKGYEVFFNHYKYGDDNERSYKFLDDKDLNKLEQEYYDRSGE